MYTKNLTVRELYKTLNTASIDEKEPTVLSFFVQGLRLNNDGMAMSALEELCRRGDTDLVAYALSDAFDDGHIKYGTTFCTTLAHCLVDVGRDVDPILRYYGKSLCEKGISIRDWAGDPTNSVNKGAVDIRSILKKIDDVTRTNALLKERFGESQS